MNQRRIFLSFVFFIAAIISIFPQVHAEPVLIKLILEKPSDCENAISLGVVVYQRFDNFVLAEFEGIKLAKLEEVGLKYQIIDEHPWSEEYFLVSSVEGIPKVNLEFYGKILLEDPKWQLLKTSKEKAIELRKLQYNVIPIPRKPIPLKYKPPLKVTKEALKYSVDIDSLVNLVSADSLRIWDLRLQNFQTRYSYSDSIHKARQWLFDKFISFGIDSVWFHHYYYDSDQYNVVATVVGTATPDKVIVVGGHYDSVVLSGNPLVWAPGADDNASGTVATLEMARIIAQNPLPVTVMFVPLAQEEQGLIGSQFFARYLYYNNTDVELMINSDMIGHSVDPDPDVEICTDPSTMHLYDIMRAMANTYTYLKPYYGGSWVSDEYSFQQLGYDAVGTIEGDFHNAGWHTNYDVVDSLDFSYMREVVKMCLATVLDVGHSPSPVENLKAVDAGDGERVYLDWSANPPEENVVYYNVRFGTVNGDYDSVHQIDATCDTLYNLEENTTYFIAVTAVNADGFESAATNEVSTAPRVIPLPPSGLIANPSGRLKIELSWFPNREADFDYYNIYRSQDSLTGYQLLFGLWRDTVFVDSTVQGGVEYYYYTLTAVDTSGNESPKSDMAKSFVISLGQGMLLVDMTLGMTSNGVESDSVNAFYQRALQGYDYTYLNHSSEYGDPLLTLQELSSYPIVIVHSEDEMAYYSLNNYLTYPVLKQYLDVGGALLIEGRKNLSGGSSVFGPQFLNFLFGDFRRDYLNVNSAYIPFWNSLPSMGYRTEEFIGANRAPQKDGYPEIVELDTFRVNHAYDPWEVDLDEKLPGVGYFLPLDGSEVIYTFVSAYDTSASDGKPVALKRLTDDFAVIYFDFPLYFVKEDIAIQILHQALSDLRTFTDVEKGDEEVEVPASFSLRQNYPNPFNSETVIEYFLPKQSSVKIIIYNILGQRVKTLLDQKETAGYKRVIWDGKNEKGRLASSGIYFYRMETEKFAQTRKMLFLK